MTHLAAILDLWIYTKQTTKYECKQAGHYTFMYCTTNTDSYAFTVHKIYCSLLVIMYQINAPILKILTMEFANDIKAV